MANRVPSWLQRWADLDALTRDKLHALVKAIGVSGLVADRTYHLQTYPQCLVWPIRQHHQSIYAFG